MSNKCQLFRKSVASQMLESVLNSVLPAVVLVKTLPRLAKLRDVFRTLSNIYDESYL